MSIGVQSYSELYTMLLGWSLYDKLWNLLTETGIAYLPFVGIILKNVAQSYTNGHDSANHGLRSMEVSLLTTLLLILLGMAPFVTLNASTISYTPLCETDSASKTYYPGNTGTTYDKAFAMPSGDIRVPLWFYAVISVSEGMTNAANTMVGCVPNLRKMITDVNTAQFSDPLLKKQLNDFETTCYAPARAQYLHDEQAGVSSNTDKIKEELKTYGADDLGWIGSHAFNTVYYRNLRATSPIQGFPYLASDDINHDTNAANPPAYGTPSCYEWWNQETNGIKAKVLKALPANFESEYKNTLDTQKAKDGAMRKMVTGIPTEYAGYDNANNIMGDYGYSRIAAALGTLYYQSQEYPKIYAAAQAAPILQSLLLLMIYVFLPFGLVFSGYKPSAFVAATAMIFSVIFWGFIWQLISWVDHSLMQALYSNWFVKQGAGATITDMIIGSLVIGAPLFWFMFMGALGVAAGNVVNGVFMSMAGISASAGAAGATQAKNLAAIAVKKAL